MTDKELKHLNRRELLEILIVQSKRNDRLQEQLDNVKSQLAEKELILANAGSIAEAAMQLNDVFGSAQRAADQYLENIHKANAEQEQRLARMEEDAKVKAQAIIDTAMEQYAQIRAEVNELVTQVIERLREMGKTYPEVEQILYDIGSEKNIEED